MVGRGNGDRRGPGFGQQSIEAFERGDGKTRLRRDATFGARFANRDQLGARRGAIASACKAPIGPKPITAMRSGERSEVGAVAFIVLWRRRECAAR